MRRAGRPGNTTKAGDNTRVQGGSLRGQVIHSTEARRDRGGEGGGGGVLEGKGGVWVSEIPVVIRLRRLIV